MIAITKNNKIYISILFVLYLNFSFLCTKVKSSQDVLQNEKVRELFQIIFDIETNHEKSKYIMNPENIELKYHESCFLFYEYLIRGIEKDELCSFNNFKICKDNLFYNLYCAKMKIIYGNDPTKELGRFKKSMNYYDEYIKILSEVFNRLMRNLKINSLKKPDVYIVNSLILFEGISKGFLLKYRKLLFTKYKKFFFEKNKKRCKDIEIEVNSKKEKKTDKILYIVHVKIRNISTGNGVIKIRRDGFGHVFIGRDYRIYLLTGEEIDGNSFLELPNGKSYEKEKRFLLKEDFLASYVTEVYKKLENSEYFICSILVPING